MWVFCLSSVLLLLLAGRFTFSFCFLCLAAFLLAFHGLYHVFTPKNKEMQFLAPLPTELPEKKEKKLCSYCS